MPNKQKRIQNAVSFLEEVHRKRIGEERTNIDDVTQTNTNKNYYLTLRLALMSSEEAGYRG